jgi:hypothetical protein
MYFYHSTTVAEVSAPAAGLILEARRGIDDALYVKVGTSYTYYLAHLILDPAIATGGAVTAGQRVGITSNLAFAIDLGVENDNVTLFFLRPDRYIDMTSHADSPLKFFQEPVKSQMYDLVRRNDSDKDGKIDFDRPGRLAGNWFLDGLPPSIPRTCRTVRSPVAP